MRDVPLTEGLGATHGRNRQEERVAATGLDASGEMQAGEIETVTILEGDCAAEATNSLLGSVGDICMA